MSSPLVELWRQEVNGADDHALRGLRIHMSDAELYELAKTDERLAAAMHRAGMYEKK